MRLNLLTCALCSLLLSACSSIDYYSQSVAGHLRLMGQRQPIDQLIEDDSTDASMRQKLQQIREIRDFAAIELQLPDNDSYRSFAAIDREAVVWAVVATAEFAVEPVTWCYPVVGCASYRGYFAQRDASHYAHNLSEEGLDVAVLPVPAYSTLGWFDDPIPSSVIRWQEPRLAGLIFHELAHQLLYVPGDSAFNEAFATTVQQVGVQRWLERRGDDAAMGRWRLQQQREREFVALLLEARQRLEQLYRQPLPEQLKRLRKAAGFARLHQDYALLQQRWGGYSGYDGWFEGQPNNAHLASVATYEEWVPAFRLLLQQAGGELKPFYRACEQLAEQPQGQRQQRLRALLDAAVAARPG